MNPWLERPVPWSSVHHWLITTLAADLAPRLRPRYFVAVETHTYVSTASDAWSASRYPDVMVIQRGGHTIKETALVEQSPYVMIDLPLGDAVEEGYLVVRVVPTGEVVTVIELLSHTNKQKGRDREAYLEKRDSLLNSHVHFVELDLLRAGPPLPFAEHTDSHYRLFIRRRERPSKARLYPFYVRDAIPTFPLPLLPDDTEPLVDLGALVAQVYERAGYDLIINYAQQPEPPLSDEDAAWAATQLNAAA
jgi:hypothetical protein